MLTSMAGHDPKDSTSVNSAVPDFASGGGRRVKGLVIGIPREYRMDGMPAEIEALWQQGIAWLKAEGAAEIVDISLPHTKYALPAYYIVAPAEASSNLARYDGVRYGLRVTGKDMTETLREHPRRGFGREVKRRIMIGTYVLSAGYYDAYYVQAQKVRTLDQARLRPRLQRRRRRHADPGAPSAAFGIGENAMKADPVEMYLNDVFTVTVNMAGLPGIAVPAGKDDAKVCRSACSSSASRSTRRRCSAARPRHRDVLPASTSPPTSGGSY
jgi:aspartyl-tRNA(Asn)/glutamyl-tRNA(Gln) amidotransferase subunit A